MAEPARPPGALGHHETGATGGARLVLVHGFTQHGGCWGPFADDLGVDHRLVLLDAPGHGASAEVHVDWDDAVAAVADAGGRGTWIGYSMGGRLALAVAVAYPALVDRLVLIGASPGITDPHERAARRRADDALADHLLAVGVDAFLDEWLAQPLFAGLSPEAAQLDARRSNTADGLAASLRQLGTGAQPDLRPQLRTLRARRLPVLVVVGADDAKFTVIGSELAAAIGPSADLATIPAAGHAAPFESPDACAGVVRRWLEATPVAGAAPPSEPPTQR